MQVDTQQLLDTVLDLLDVRYTKGSTWYEDRKQKFCSLLSQQVAADDWISVERLFAKMGEWSKKKFSDAGAEKHFLKLQHEAKEAENNINDLEEQADCLLCLFAGTFKAGFTLQELIQAAIVKFLIIQQRTWKKLEDGTYQHL